MTVVNLKTKSKERKKCGQSVDRNSKSVRRHLERDQSGDKIIKSAIEDQKVKVKIKSEGA